MIKISIAVNKVDKSKFFLKKNGDKMLDMVLIETPDNKYETDYVVVQDSTKEERDAGKRGAILGNGKIFETKGNRGNGKPATKGDDSEDW